MISTADKIRIGLAPVHVLLGGALIVDYWRGAHSPLVLVLGALFVGYGVYRLALVKKAFGR